MAVIVSTRPDFFSFFSLRGLNLLSVKYDCRAPQQTGRDGARQEGREPR